ncbi:LutB/LldF family L-lactate oxidation iron-sulfur protein [Rhodococcus sp. HNM0569]|uniref:LutB/LldF family L-lactate oxidation iron-sulfur protein n=1 Tax=Rhodococcus sp. HNM0569 TaxID=2716340 RepID=UPI00146DF77B|nr:LutB/LldF family L-lactate oxidation iron-sulfur protein [Rhodococcus sp. HNM0569]NLU83666.1 iron-sulfur cluster-binding protein [Rhodococcus sp. HNM0569]
MPPFPEAAPAQLRNSQQRINLEHATHTIRGKRNRLVAEKDDWDALRTAGAAAKNEVLLHLDTYLQQFEDAATAAGATVHWAPDAHAANRIVTEIAIEQGVTEVVKAKSMATEEIGLVEALAAAGIDAYETDLAELIVQLSGDIPSHIVVPAIHRNRSEIREIFTRNMKNFGRPAPDDLGDEPRELADAARRHLREKFLSAKMAVSGANFAVAESGALLLVESEGNGRMCVTMPETLVSVVGIEKLVPTWRDLEIYLQLLARSATGERMNPYTSVWSGVHDGDGPQNVHIVLLDNNRTDVLADEVGRQALRCIRCAACLNVCPVYERAGGHAYGSVYPGPIGAILTPMLRGLGDKVDQELPYASSLCGACYEACPMEINIPRVLVQLRADVVDRERTFPPSPERVAMKAAAAMFDSPGRLGLGEKLAGLSHKVIRGERGITNVPGFGSWFSTRDIGEPPAESFRGWWERTDGGRDDHDKPRHGHRPGEVPGGDH